MRMKVAAVIFIVTMLILIGQTSRTQAWTPEQNFVRDPGKIPYFSDYTTPIIQPGSSGDLSFSITNRYYDNMENVKLFIDLFGLGTIEYEKKLKDIHNPPRLSSNGALYGSNKQSIILPLNRIPSNNTPLVKSIRIDTSGDTEEGTYFVRFNLSFIYKGNNYLMLSRGYFSDSDWKFAMDNPGDESMNLNMSYLFSKYGSIAIIPETAFPVKSPIPLWPFYLLVSLTIMFAALAVIFYLQEEQNKFPRLEKALQKWTGKFYQSRRFLKKRMRKVRGKV